MKGAEYVLHGLDRVANAMMKTPRDTRHPNIGFGIHKVLKRFRSSTTFLGMTMKTLCHIVPHCATLCHIVPHCAFGNGAGFTLLHGSVLVKPLPWEKPKSWERKVEAELAQYGPAIRPFGPSGPYR